MKWFVFKCQVITSPVILGHDNHEFLSEAVPATAEWTPLLPGGAGRASVPLCTAKCCTMPCLPTLVRSGPKAVFVCLGLIRAMGK